VIRVDVSGTVDLRGEAIEGGAVTLSGQEIGTALLHRLKDHLQREQTLGQQHGRWSDPMI